MRLPPLALFALAIVGCSSSEVTTTSSSGSAPKPAASAAKSVAAPASASAASPTASASAAPTTALKDADAELKSIDPFNETATDGAQRLLTAMTLCGEPAADSEAPWGRDVADDKAAPAPPKASRCSAETHAKLFMKSASMLADGKEASLKKTAEEHAYFGLALDPKATMPTGANAAATALLAAVKKRPPTDVRMGAVTTSDEATSKELEKAAAGDLASGVRLCYASALFDNRNLQGNLAIEAEVAADGTLSDVKASGSLPDQAVIACVTRFSNRSKVNKPSRTPTRVSVPFALAPGDGAK